MDTFLLAFFDGFNLLFDGGCDGFWRREFLGSEYHCCGVCAFVEALLVEDAFEVKLDGTSIVLGDVCIWGIDEACFDSPSESEEGWVIGWDGGMGGTEGSVILV